MDEAWNDVSANVTACTPQKWESVINTFKVICSPGFLSGPSNTCEQKALDTVCETASLSLDQQPLKRSNASKALIASRAIGSSASLTVELAAASKAHASADLCQDCKDTNQFGTTCAESLSHCATTGPYISPYTYLYTRAYKCLHTCLYACLYTYLCTGLYWDSPEQTTALACPVTCGKCHGYTIRALPLREQKIQNLVGGKATIPMTETGDFSLELLSGNQSCRLLTLTTKCMDGYEKRGTQCEPKPDRSAMDTRVIFASCIGVVLALCAGLLVSGFNSWLYCSHFIYFVAFRETLCMVRLWQLFLIRKHPHQARGILMPFLRQEVKLAMAIFLELWYACTLIHTYATVQALM